jgi:hypothetical protein
VASPQSSRPDNAIAELWQHERFRQMIEYLRENKDELLKAQKLQLIFNCAGPKVRGCRTIYDE